MNRLRGPLCAFAILLAGCGAVFAQDAVPTDTPSGKAAARASGDSNEPPAPIYEAKLLRLSEILGSLSFLRDLCGDSDGPAWRAEMNVAACRGGAAAAAPDAAHRPLQPRLRDLQRRLPNLHAFGRLAISRYLSEGQSLASDVRGRYSQ